MELDTCKSEIAWKVEQSLSKQKIIKFCTEFFLIFAWLFTRKAGIRIPKFTNFFALLIKRVQSDQSKIETQPQKFFLLDNFSLKFFTNWEIIE